MTKNVTIEAQLTGYKQTKSETQNVGTKFQHYVLIEYPIGQANQALLSKIQQMKFSAHKRLQTLQWQSLRLKLKRKEAAPKFQNGGEADANQDNKITAGELHSYVQTNVIQQSSGSQTPGYKGDADRELVQFQ